MALIAVLILLVAVAIFAVENATPVTLQFAVWSVQTSLVYLVLGAVLIGALIATGLWANRLFGLRRRLHEAEARLRKADADLAGLRGPITTPVSPAVRESQTPGGIL